MPYKLKTVLTGTRHGAVALTATTPGLPGKGFTALTDSTSYNTATVKIAITPDKGYVIRTGFPKAYKTTDPAKVVALTPQPGKPDTSTFKMPSYPVTIKMAYMELLKSIPVDTLTLDKRVPTVSEMIARLPAKLAVTLSNGRTDSVAVSTAGWKLSGTTFNPAASATNRFNCTLTLPDSIGANSVALNGYIDVINWSLITTIANEADLQEFRDNVNVGENYAGKTVTLKNDIELKAVWTPAGNSPTVAFNGTFDGAGYIIGGLNVNLVNATTPLYAGLIGYMDSKAVLKNLGLKGSVTAGGSQHVYAGGIAGWNNGGKITNCYTSVTVSLSTSGKSSTANGGGIAGYTTGTIGNCYTTGAITATGELAAVQTGGIAGNNVDGSINSCFAMGTIKGGKSVGGIVGESNKAVTNCIALNTGGITGSTAGRVIGAGTNPSASHASPLIQINNSLVEGGTATDKNGAPLTVAFLTAKAGTDVFTGWTEANWFFGTTTDRLPQVKTTDLATNNPLGKQVVPLRTAFFEPTIEVEGDLVYNKDKHEGKPLAIGAGGKLVINTPDASLASLEMEEGGQLIIEKELTITGTLSTKRELNNKWTAFGSPILLTVDPDQTNETLYSLTGYKSASEENQLWDEISETSPIDMPAGEAILLATEEAKASVTFCSSKGIKVPVSKTITLGEALKDGEFVFQCNPSLCNQTLKNIYILSADGKRFEVQKTDYTVAPFQSFLVANSVTTATVKSLRVSGNGTPTGNAPIVPGGSFRIWGADGQLHLSAAQPAEVLVVDMNGRILHRFRLDGERTLTLNRGVYLVRCNNITYKVSL